MQTDLINTQAEEVKKKFSLWSWLGFAEPYVFMPEGNAFVITRSNLSWKDRIRVLVTGNVSVYTALKTEPHCSIIQSASKLRVERP